MEKELNKIIEDLKDFVQEAGFKKVIVGSSGGIDSAIVLAISKLALGSKNVLAVTMPSKHSSDGSVLDSIELCGNLGVQLLEIPIENMVNTFDNELYEFDWVNKTQTANENLQSRLRMIILMYISNSNEYLLMETGNKTEAMTGYFTLWGDSAGAIAPIGELYKTQVYELAKYINEKHDNIIPQEIIDKEPSAELSEDQKDINNLPYGSYEKLDEALKKIENKDFQEDEEFKNLVGLINKNSFKLQFLPPTINLNE